MANSVKAIPIRSARSMQAQQQEIVELAFEHWLARFGLLEGSPEDDFYRAQREVMARRSRSRDTAARLFVVGRADS